MILSTRLYALPNDVIAEIAQEMFENGEYNKAINKCKDVKNFKPCLDITQKATNKLNELQKKKEQEADEHQRIAEKKLAEQQKLKEEERQKIADEERKENEKMNSPVFAKAMLCSCSSGLLYWENRLEKENKIALVSGVINKNEKYRNCHG